MKRFLTVGPPLWSVHQRRAGWRQNRAKGAACSVRLLAQNRSTRTTRQEAHVSTGPGCFLLLKSRSIRTFSRSSL